MKFTKRILSITLAVIMCITLVIPAFAKNSQERLKYLVIGDSIADAYGILNGNYAGYGYIVADTNEYDVTVNAYSGGETTNSLLRKIRNSKILEKQIAEADIISISIGGNDYFLDDYESIDIDRIVKMALRYMFLKDSTKLDEIAANARENFYSIMQEIRTINPNAVVVAQTLYKAWYGLTGKAYDEVTKRINGIFYDYKAQHPEKFAVAEVAEAFKGHKDYVTADTIHPSAKGNVAIAKAILETLYELGLGKSTEPVITTQGIDYNYWLDGDKSFRNVMLYFIVRLATGRLFVK